MSESDISEGSTSIVVSDRFKANGHYGDLRQQDPERGQDFNEVSEEDEQRYTDYPLVLSLIRGRNIRIRSFSTQGKLIHSGVKSNRNWLRTIFLCKARAFDVFFVPWLIVTVNASIWTYLVLKPLKGTHFIPNTSWNSLYSLFLTTTLAFLLVFRLNRVAVRWWETRMMWGSIVAESRILASRILDHTNHDPTNRDLAIRWLAGFVVSVKQHIRYEKRISEDELCGYLTPGQVESLSLSPHPSLAHPCLKACAELRHALKSAFRVTPDTSTGLATAFSSEMKLMEQPLHKLVNEMGGLERVRSTPLPIVFVTHLRTFLFLYLLSLPYFYAHEWGWATIPSVALTAYALMGIDGAASECESPFRRDSLNHLDMEDFCSTALSNIEQLVIHNANMQLSAQE